MHRHSLAGILLSFGTLIVAACGSGESPTGAASSGTGGEGATSSSTTTGATGGTGGTGGATSSSSTGATGGGGSGTLGDHLVISEVCSAPAGGEFVELYNPTAAAVDLTDYYLSDNSAYHGIATGAAWNPVGTAGTDFLARFPAGTMLAPGAALVIATDPTFEMTYTKCPDFILGPALTCATGTAKAMLAPTNGGIGDQIGHLLSNEREMVILFRWDGSAAVVKDVDYVTWGSTFDEATRVDKTGIAGYSADTAKASQKAAAAPAPTQSIERCGSAFETGEKSSGGNGLTGHDETSEPLDATFKIQAAPTPGTKNACL